ncbi:unnamed protein product [Sphagnum jensenii]
MSRSRDHDIWLRSSGDRVIHSLGIAADPLLVGCRVRDARSRSLCASFREADLSLQCLIHRIQFLLLLRVTGGDSGGFMSTVAESTATAQWEESVAKSALLEMSGEGLLGLLAEGVPDSAAAATALR